MINYTFRSQREGYISRGLPRYRFLLAKRCSAACRGVFHFGVIVLMLSLLPSVSVAQDAPSLSLFTFSGERTTVVSPGDPLLLLVSINNSAAQSVRLQNRTNKRIIDQFSETEEYRDFSDQERAALTRDYPVRALPEIVLGSETESLESLISVQLRNANGENVGVSIQPLASNDRLAKAVSLQVDEPLIYRFAVAPEQLQALPEGVYHLVAALDTRRHSNMWQGWAYSNTVKATLGSGSSKGSGREGSGREGSGQRALLLGSYFLGDHQYLNAQAHALSWTERSPDSVDAWRQLGEALYGQGKKQQSLQAFNTALTKFHLKYGDRPPEMPDKLLARIQQLEGEEL